MSDIKEALAAIWAGNPVNTLRYETLELIHPAFVDADGNPSSHRLVNHRLDPLTVTLETGAQATFLPGAFAVRLPEKGVQGRQDMQITLDGVSREVVRQLERAADADRAPIIARFREYAETDLTEPGLMHELTVISPKVTPTRVTATAVFVDPINLSFPRILYTTDTHPSLVG